MLRHVFVLLWAGRELAAGEYARLYETGGASSLQQLGGLTHGLGDASASAVAHGDGVFLRVKRTGKRITAQKDGSVHANWDHRGSWQTFVIERKAGPGEVESGDPVFLKAWTGKLLTVQGEHVHAKWDHKGSWQTFVIERKQGPGLVAPGDVVFLKAHTSARLDADTPDSAGGVQARWPHLGSWQEFVIEGKEQTTATRSPTQRPTSTLAPPPSTPPVTTPPASLDSAFVLAMEHFRLLNELRASGFTCPNGTKYPPNAVALKFDCALWRASQLHSADMAAKGYLSHTSQDGRSPWDRARAQNTTAESEDFTATNGTAQGTLEQFKKADLHCNNMMDLRHTVAAVGYAAGGPYRHYWTRMFRHGASEVDATCMPRSIFASGLATGS